jgi:hypothetical protein
VLEIVRFDPTPCGYPKPRIPVLPKRLQLNLFSSSSSRQRPGSGPSTNETADSLEPRHSGEGRNPGNSTNWTPAFAGVTNSSALSFLDSGLRRNDDHGNSNFRSFARGRYALCAAYELAGLKSETTLLAPSYHCLTMLDPAIHLGADVQLYPLNPDLSPNIEQLDILFGECTSPVKALVATHFFGIRQDFTLLQRWCQQRDIVLIEDCSHTLFTEDCQAPGIGLFGSLVTASPYKFYPCEDGGLLHVSDPSCFSTTTETPKHSSPRRRPGSSSLDFLDSGLRRNDDFSMDQHVPDTVAPSLSAELRVIKHTLEHHVAALMDAPDDLDRQLSTLLQTPNTRAATTRHEYKEPSNSFSPILINRSASRISRWLIRRTSPESIAEKRRSNYSRWLDATRNLPNGHPLYPQLPDDCVPYMFPLYIDHPEPHFDLLKRLGFPVWRWDEMAVSACRVATDYRLHLLHLPCHQSLTEAQMDWLVAAIRQVMQTPADGER